MLSPLHWLNFPCGDQLDTKPIAINIIMEVATVNLYEENLLMYTYLLRLALAMT